MAICIDDYLRLAVTMPVMTHASSGSASMRSASQNMQIARLATTSVFNLRTTKRAMKAADYAGCLLHIYKCSEAGCDPIPGHASRVASKYWG